MLVNYSERRRPRNVMGLCDAFVAAETHPSDRDVTPLPDRDVTPRCDVRPPTGPPYSPPRSST